jgi:hypothetical protein
VTLRYRTSYETEPPQKEGKPVQALLHHDYGLEKEAA